MPLFVCGNEQRPLVRIAALSFDDVAPKIVFGGPDVFHQTRMKLAMRVKSAPKIA